MLLFVAATIKMRNHRGPICTAMQVPLLHSYKTTCMTYQAPWKPCSAYLDSINLQCNGFMQLLANMLGPAGTPACISKDEQQQHGNFAQSAHP